MNFVLVIRRAEEGGYWAEVAGLEGVFVQGETLEELLSEAPEAIRSHLDALSEDGQRASAERVIVATIEVGAPAAA